MTYRVRQFNGVVVPEYITRGNVQNMGTGNALTSFLPLPGGGFYDNYRRKKSPQGIRPISKSGVFWGDEDELEAELNVWRAMIGERGVLTLEYDNGALRWQWARLQDVDAPRPSDAKGGWLPFTMTWISAAQNWRGVTHGQPGWTWGDESWVFGDGTAEFGVGPETYILNTIDQSIVVNQGGDIDAPNVVLHFDIVGTWQDLTVINETTGQQFIIERDAADTTPGVEIDASARSIYLLGGEAAISSILRDRDGLEVEASAHGLVSGDTVRIAGTDIYDGDYYPIGSDSATEFSYLGIPINPRSYGTVTTGTARKLTDAYDVTTITDKAEWFVLAPGDNTLRVVWSTFPTSATLTVEYVDHYA